MNQNYYKSLVWPFIENYLQNNIQFDLNSKYLPLVEYHKKIVMEYPLRQGKYLRPSLVLMTAGAMGFDINKAIPIAAAMQMSEDWILCHDDIEDDSDTRRGAPTLHKIYGIPLAVNAGDALQSLNWQLIYEINNPAIFQEFKKIINRTALGQTIEVKWITESNFDLKEEDINLIMESKTCYYSISGPMRLGAILAGATDKQLDSIYKFGLALGKAFQIIDDFLDLTSDFDGQKGHLGNDIYEGKRTVFLIDVISKSKDPKIIEIISKSRDSKNQDEIEYVISQMAQFGSLEYGYNLALKYASDAREIFKNELSFLVEEPYRGQIELFIDFIVNRNK